MKQPDAPVACTLSDEAYRARRSQVRDLMRTSAREVRERPDGFALRFDRDTETVRMLGELIAFESACCGFLRFDLQVGAEGEAVWLTIGGSAEAKAFVRGVVTAVA
jgi:hypothetical protein